jgi:hypothetical protein
MATYIFVGYLTAVVLLFAFLIWKAMRRNGVADQRLTEYENRKGIAQGLQGHIPPQVTAGPFVNQLRDDRALAETVLVEPESAWWSTNPPKDNLERMIGCLAASAVAAATIAGGDGGAEVDGDDDEEKRDATVGDLTCNADDSSPAESSAPETADPPAPADVATEEEPERED